MRCQIENIFSGHFSKFSKISNTRCLPKKSLTNSADPDKTASAEAIWSGSSLFAILTSILLIPALITKIYIVKRKW